MKSKRNSNHLNQMKKTITITLTISTSGKVSVSTAGKQRKPYAKRRVRKTGTTYTDRWGKEWPIYETKGGRKFAVRKSKNRSKYKHYIK